MAIFNSNPKHQLTGSLGELIFYKIKGQTRVRSKPSTVNQPNSELQLLQLSRMRAVVSFYNANKETLVRNIWRYRAKNRVQSGYNLFVKANIQAFDAESKIMDPTLLHISTGMLEMPPKLNVVAENFETVRISWKNVLPANSPRQKDRLIIAWMTGDNHFKLNFITDADTRRRDGECLIDIGKYHDNEIGMFLFFMSATETGFSEDQYFHVVFQ